MSTLLTTHLEERDLPTDYKEAKHIAAIVKKGYFVLDGILYYDSSEVPSRRYLVIPQQLRDKVVFKNHNAIFSGHFLVKKLDVIKIETIFLLARNEFYGVQKCELCLTCATIQGQERRKNPELHSVPVREPFACIGMNLKEMNESYNKNQFALVTYQSGWKFIL